MVHDGCNYFSFWATFCPFTPLTAWKKKFLKMKKTHGDIIILHKYPKNYNQMMYSSWDMVHSGCNYFWFWAIFWPFTPLTAQKIKNTKIWKYAWRYHHFTYVYQKMMYGQMMYGWMIRWCVVPEIWCVTSNCYFSF